MINSVPLQQAIKKIGSQEKVARLCKVSQATVSKWIYRYRIPPKHVLKLEKATHGAVTRHELRPDIYPRE